MMSGPKFHGNTPGMNPNAHKFIDGFSCKEAMEDSLTCLTDNNYDSSKCGDYYKAYEDCKREWLRAKRKQNKTNL